MPLENSAFYLTKAIKSAFWGTLWILVRTWKLFSLYILGARCRFHPSCSEYAYHAVREQGIVKGTWLAIKRLLSCHPLHRERENK